MNVESRLQRLQQLLAARGDGRPCDCEPGRVVTLDESGRVICNKCRGLIPEGTKIDMPAGMIPAPPAE